jgi:hypothetical protein
MRFGIACHSGFGPKFAKESKKQQKRPHETSWAAAVKHLFHAAHNCPSWQDAPAPHSPPRRAVMWGMKQILAAHRPKTKKMS